MPSQTDLWRTPLSDHVKAVQDRLRDDGAAPNHLRAHDYQRWSYTLDLADGGAMLDVGIGLGQFVAAASRTGRFHRIVGVDVKPHSQLMRLSPDVELDWTSIAALPFDDRTFDFVSCQECLEHLDDATLAAGLAELRRVCRGRLVVTVPWDEQEPLTRGHLQTFDRDRIGAMFPDGQVTLLHKKGGSWPWALIVEDHR